MDFMIINTLFGKRLHLLIIMQLKTRKITSWEITEFPSREFVRQRLILFSEEVTVNPVLIHDNASVFSSIDFKDYGIREVNTCVGSPNMNAFVERLNGTIRREALDHFLLISQKQVRNIISEFVDFYTNHRIHQGINKIPDAEIHESSGLIKKMKILSGLHHHYYRSSA